MGPLRDAQFAQAIVSFADRHGIPVFADILSQARGVQAPSVVAHYDLVLSAAQDLVPKLDLVIRFGAEPTSRALSGMLANLGPGVSVFTVDDTSWYRDASSSTTSVIVGDLADWLATAELSAQWIDGSYTAWWRDSEASAAALVNEFTDEHWFEGAAVRAAVEAVPSHGQCFLGNSRPIRDADALAVPAVGVFVDANRGASGIDGVTSTAFGEVCAQPDRPTVLCIGDVSFYHDLNGLLAADRFGASLTVVLIHNEGGGIFQHLSQASRQDVLHWFTTPHHMAFEPIVQGYGGRYVRVEGLSALREEIGKSVARKGLTVIEAHFGNDASVAVYARLRERLGERLRTGEPR